MCAPGEALPFPLLIPYCGSVRVPFVAYPNPSAFRLDAYKAPRQRSQNPTMSPEEALPCLFVSGRFLDRLLVRLAFYFSLGAGSLNS
jgi:hypothetical protein